MSGGQPANRHHFEDQLKFNYQLSISGYQESIIHDDYPVGKETTRAACQKKAIGPSNALAPGLDLPMPHNPYFNNLTPRSRSLRC